MLYPKLRGADIMRKINLKTIKIYFLVLFFLFLLVTSSVFSAENKKDLYSLEDISNSRQFHLSPAASELLRKNGFVVTPAYYKEISDVYLECKDNNQPIFITTDAVLHTGHIFFDYLLRILEVEKLYVLQWLKGSLTLNIRLIMN
jgi:uncharacterized membrane protein